MSLTQIRRISTLIDLTIKDHKSSSFKRSKWSPIPIPHKRIQELKGQDLDNVNVAHSHILHSDWASLDKLLTNFNSFRVKHVLLKLQNDYSASLKFFKWVEQHNPNLLTLETNSIILHILTKNRKFVSAESVLKKIIFSSNAEMHSKLFDFILHSYRMCDSTPRVFDALFKLYAQTKQFRNATDAFCRMKEYGFLPTTESCNLYMSSLLSKKRVGIVLSFYKEMMRSKIVVNVFTLNMVINAFCQLGKLENAVQVFDEMQDMGLNPRVSSYNTLISAYIRKGLFTTGMKLKSTMEKNGVASNVITYNTIIHGFCKEGKLREGYKMFSEMKSMNVAPDTVTYNVLISGYCQSGQTEKGTQIFEEILRNGIKANIVTYNALLLGLCNEGKTRKAAYLVQELDKKKLVPNSSTFAALIRGQCTRKNPERAFQLYRSMIKSGCHPNQDIVKMLMSSFLQNNDFDGAFCMFKEMLERPIGPEYIILGELCKGFTQVWKDRLVLSLLKEVDDRALERERFEKIESIILTSNVEGKVQ